MKNVTTHMLVSLAISFALAVAPSKSFADSKVKTESTCKPVSNKSAPDHPNLTLLRRLNLRNLDASRSIIAKDFVWHYFNPRLPELHGDYLGLEGLKQFFLKLHKISNGSFRATVVDRIVVGDELVIIQTCNRITLEKLNNETVEFDVVVVWRIVDGKIAEGWDIPSIYTVRKMQKGNTK